MNLEVKEKWLKALRSGEYSQTQKVLRRTEAETTLTGNEIPVGFCCLGVLCDLAENSWVISSYDGHGVVYFGEEQEIGTLPKAVRDWAGLDNENPVVVYNNAATTLANLNDNYGLNFEQIAKLVEEQL